MTVREPATPYDWQDGVACAQVATELFFPLKGGTATDARRICGSCDAKLACLDYALRTNQTEGIWGGTTPLERARMRRRAA